MHAFFLGRLGRAGGKDRHGLLSGSLGGNLLHVLGEDGLFLANSASLLGGCDLFRSGLAELADSAFLLHSLACALDPLVSHAVPPRTSSACAAIRAGRT